MHHRAVHAVEQLVEDPLAHQHRADRHMPARKRLREQHHVGLDVPMLDREEAAGAPEAGLDLVGDEQRAVAAADLGGRLQIAVGRQVDALALDRLDDEGRASRGGQRALQRRQVVERNAVQSGSSGSKPSRKIASPLSDSAP